jgi:peptidoglycan LD-endopeptidase LytH
MMYGRPIRHPVWLVLAVLAGGCAPALTHGVSSSPRGQYERELRAARPHGESVAAEWTATGNAAAHAASRVSVPFEEAVHFTAHRASAVAYRVTLRRADRFAAAVDPPRLRERGVFVELFEVVPGATERLLLIARSERGAHTLRTLIPRTGEYVLLVQPRLEHGGRYRIAFGTGAQTPLAATATAATVIAALTFPVHGVTMRAIGSRYGEPRDGGARAHHGVDIFAPRGTPVLAAADGRITNVANTRVGGRVIWQIADDTGLELYYAHLDAQQVRVGQRVRAGEQIGRVGNTGNARTTPPHLHFGVYLPGRAPVDPAPLLAAGGALERPVATVPPASAARADLSAAIDIGALGSWLRTAVDQAPLHASPSDGSPSVVALRAGTPIRLVGGTTAWYRVALPDGVLGFVNASAVAQLPPPQRRIGIRGRTPLLEHTTPDARPIETIYGGESVEVLGEYERHLLVRTTTGQIGWIDAP